MSTVVDSAQYLIEPPDLFSHRLPAKLRDRGPRVVNMPDGGEGWSYDNGAWLRPLGVEAGAGHSPLDLKGHGYRYADIRKGMHEAKARLEDLRIDGVDVALIFPTFALDIRSLTDPELHLACIQAYNQGVWDWTQHGDSRKLIPQALMPAAGIPESLAELQRVAKQGFRGIIFNGYPSGGNTPTKDDEPFFKLCEEAGIVINLLRGGPIGNDRTPVAPQQYIGAAGADTVRPAEESLDILLAQQATIKNLNVAWLIFSGITERMPKLKISLVDAGAGWIRTTGELMDWNYRYMQHNMPARLEYIPSDYLKRNFKATLTNERFAVVARHEFGEDYLLWATNYPNSTSTWPNSGRAAAETLLGIPEPERAGILGATAARWYGLTLPSLALA